MKNKTMTAVEWLFEKLNQCEPMYSGVQSNEHKEYIDMLIKQAKEMEKEQKIDAFDTGRRKGDWIFDGEKYYEETYKNETK
jgi:hypothetical protein